MHAQREGLYRAVDFYSCVFTSFLFFRERLWDDPERLEVLEREEFSTRRRLREQRKGELLLMGAVTKASVKEEDGRRATEL